MKRSVRTIWARSLCATGCRSNIELVRVLDILQSEETNKNSFSSRSRGKKVRGTKYNIHVFQKYNNDDVRIKDKELEMSKYQVLKKEVERWQPRWFQ